MKSIKAKITAVAERGDIVELVLAEHEAGFFSSSGTMKIVCNRQATIDLNQVVSGMKAKGGSISGRARGLLEGTTIQLIFHPK